MKIKKIPAIIMLIAGSVACIITYLNGYDLKDMLITLVWVLILFLIIGIAIQLIFEKFEIGTEPEKVTDDGEVVDKTGDEDSENAEGAKEGADGAAAGTFDGETLEKDSRIGNT